MADIDKLNIQGLLSVNNLVVCQKNYTSTAYKSGVVYVHNIVLSSNNSLTATGAQGNYASFILIDTNSSAYTKSTFVSKYVNKTLKVIYGMSCNGDDDESRTGYSQLYIYNNSAYNCASSSYWRYEIGCFGEFECYGGSSQTTQFLINSFSDKVYSMQIC